MNFGLLLLRLLLAALLCGHGAQKLFGRFGGAGPDAAAAVFERWGFVPGRPMVLLAGLAELTGAASLATGLLAPGGCAVIVGTMTVAAVATAPNGFWAQQGGCEVPFWYGATAAVLGYTGPGAWSLDHAVGLDTLHGPGWGTAALAVGSATAAVPLVLRSRVLRTRAQHHNEVTS
ncbi:DoxX family protein [Streptomyces sp. LN325]|uniref:DoxX family protein n=1 Tax=Streptomyces sp. LN325 TaxID=3112976 RepID=UPI00371C57E5